jgi:hypothetical protein
LVAAAVAKPAEDDSSAVIEEASLQPPGKPEGETLTAEATMAVEEVENPQNSIVTKGRYNHGTEEDWDRYDDEAEQERIDKEAFQRNEDDPDPHGFMVIAENEVCNEQAHWEESELADA